MPFPQLFNLGGKAYFEGERSCVTCHAQWFQSYEDGKHYCNVAEDRKLNRFVGLNVSFWLRRCEAGLVHPSEVAGILMSWHVGQVRAREVYKAATMSFANGSDQIIYSELNSQKYCHKTIMKHMRRHKEISLQILRWMPSCACNEYFDGRENMLAWLKDLKREIFSLPAA